MTDRSTINRRGENRTFFVSILWGCVLGILSAGGTEIVRMIFFHNQHVVLPGMVYRTAQLKEPELKKYVALKNIRTIVNLRGRPISEWYVPECSVSQALGISQEDVTTSANRLPSPHEISRLIEVFDRSEYPILIHCQQGADRTGLASTAWQLLYTDADYASARLQCSPRYGHFRLMSTANMDYFFDQYENWLATRASSHSPALFREWALHHYKAGYSVADLSLKEPPTELPTGIPFVLTMKARNVSDQDWDLKAGTILGVHCRYWIYDAQSKAIFFGQAGFKNALVKPGQSVDIELAMPPLEKPGRYRLLADLSRQNYDFFQFGSEPLVHEWNATHPAKPVK